MGSLLIWLGFYLFYRFFMCLFVFEIIQVNIVFNCLIGCLRCYYLPGGANDIFWDVNNNHVCYILFLWRAILGLKVNPLVSIIFFLSRWELAACCFFISFFLKSLLCYYAVFCGAVLLVNSRSKILSFRANMKFLLRTLDFFILPFCFCNSERFFRLMVFMRGIIRLRFRDIFFLFIGIYTRF